jgi:hypothetical protein
MDGSDTRSVISIAFNNILVNIFTFLSILLDFLPETKTME